MVGRDLEFVQALAQIPDDPGDAPGTTGRCFESGQRLVHLRSGSVEALSGLRVLTGPTQVGDAVPQEEKVYFRPLFARESASEGT